MACACLARERAFTHCDQVTHGLQSAAASGFETVQIRLRRGPPEALQPAVRGNRRLKDSRQNGTLPPYDHPYRDRAYIVPALEACSSEGWE